MKRFPPLLIAALVVGALLRGYQLGESLWLDELHTSWTVRGSFNEVFERAAIGNQSPLYFWLAWFFARLPGSPEIALRLPSMLAGCALPAAMYWLTNRLVRTKTETADNTAALVAAWLTAVDPTGIFYSQEARPYALVQLVAVLHIGWLLQLLTADDRRVRIAWIASGAVLVHLHYTAGLVLAAEAVALALIAATANKPGERRAIVVHRGADLLTMLLLISPAFIGMFDVASRRNNWRAFVEPQPFQMIFTLFPWTPAGVALVVLNRSRQALPERSLAVLSSWLFVPLLVTWALTHFDVVPLFYARYLLAVWPASLLAAAICVLIPRSPAVRSLLAGLVMAIAISNSQLIQNWRDDGRLLRDRNEDWALAVARLNEELATSPAPVLVRSGYIETDELATRHDGLFRAYCVSPVRGMYAAKCPDARLFPLGNHHPGKLTDEARAALLESQRAWLLVRTSSEEVRKQLEKELRESIGADHSLEFSEPERFGGVYLQQATLRD